MNKQTDSIIKFFIGFFIFIVLSMLMFLGFKIFIPAPQYPTQEYSYRQPQHLNCASTDSACLNRQLTAEFEQEAEREKMQKDYQRDLEIYRVSSLSYGGTIFMVANIIGVIVLLAGIASFALSLGTNVSVAITFAGAYGIIHGYVLGWNGADDAIKFIVGLIVAIIAIAGAVMFNRSRAKVVIPSTPPPPPPSPQGFPKA